MGIFLYGGIGLGFFALLFFGWFFFLRRREQAKKTLFEGGPEAVPWYKGGAVGVLKGLLGLSKHSEGQEGKVIDFGDNKIAVGEKEGFGFGGGKGPGGGGSGGGVSQPTEEKLKISRKKLEESIKKSGKSFKKISSSKESPSLRGEKEKGKGRGEGPSFRVDARQSINIQEALGELKGTDLGGILSSLKKEQHEYLLEKIMKLKFATKKDFFEAVIDELADVLEEGYKELAYRLSKLRKAGKDVNSLAVKLMSVPLKVKVFRATLSRKDFDICIGIMEKVDFLTKDLEKTIEKKETN